MTKITIYTIGKTKEAWLVSALLEYEKRLPFAIEWRLCKTDKQLIAALPSSYTCLTPNGPTMTSEDFTDWFYTDAPRHFVIGGPEGLPSEITSKTHSLLSFSPMTFTHQITRLILLEQLYRATQIHKGTAYHK